MRSLEPRLLTLNNGPARMTLKLMLKVCSVAALVLSYLSPRGSPHGLGDGDGELAIFSNGSLVLFCGGLVQRSLSSSSKVRRRSNQRGRTDSSPVRLRIFPSNPASNLRPATIDSVEQAPFGPYLFRSS
jgi:hypothetical protein